MENNISEKIAEAIKNYAQKKDISLYGNIYKTYSMLKYPTPLFPENKMFLSSNARGKQGKKNVIIVAFDDNTICDCPSEHILERPINRFMGYKPQMHRLISANIDISISF